MGNMFKTSLKIGILALALTQAACSQRWYEVDPGGSEADVQLMISEIDSATNVKNFDSSIAIDIWDNDPGASIYYKKSTEKFRPENLLQITDMGAFMQNFGGLNVFNAGLEEASVLFMDGITAEGERRFVLIVHSTVGGRKEPFAVISAPGDYEFSDDTFRVYFTAADGTGLILETTDLDADYEDTLGTHVKFKVFKVTGPGALIDIGQIAPLAGLAG